jgi:hypothetical protein
MLEEEERKEMGIRTRGIKYIKLVPSAKWARGGGRQPMANPPPLRLRHSGGEAKVMKP